MSRECICGATIRRMTLEGAFGSVARWVGPTVDPPHEVGSFCYPNSPNEADQVALHEPLENLQPDVFEPQSSEGAQAPEKERP